MRALALAAAALLAGCGSGRTCDASNCATGCCDGDRCRTEFSEQTCSTGAAACVACDAAFQRCAPPTRSCERIVLVRLSYVTYPDAAAEAHCTGAQSCTAEARVWESAYPALAVDPGFAACVQLQVQQASAALPAIFSWAGCTTCAGACCPTPQDAFPLQCGFHPSGAL